jgi:5-methylthioribose kinase
MSQQPFVELLHAPAELAAMLDRLGLARTGDPIHVTPLTGGVSSSIFRVDVADQTFCVKQSLPQLKVAKEWLAPTDRIFSEIHWLQTAGKIVPDHVPRIVGVDEAFGAFVMEFLAGEHVHNWKQQLLNGEVDPSIGSAVGEALGRVHGYTEAGSECAPAVDGEGNFYQLRLEPYLIECTRQHPALARRLIELVHSVQHNSRVLVHGDVSPKNILIRQGQPVILDAECAYRGDPAFDLAFFINHLVLKAIRRPQDRQALGALLARFYAAYAPFVTWEPVADVERRTAALLPGLLLGRVDGKSPIEYLDDLQRSRTRAVAIQLLKSPALTLPVLWAEVMALT